MLGEFDVKINEIVNEGPLGWAANKVSNGLGHLGNYAAGHGNALMNVGREFVGARRKPYGSGRRLTPDELAAGAANLPSSDDNPDNGPANEPEKIGGEHNPKHDLAPGVSIVSQEPIILKYKNNDYGLNDNGQWVKMATGKVQHEAFQDFLDKQHTASLNNQSQAQPATQQAQPATQQAQPATQQAQPATRASTLTPNPARAQAQQNTQPQATGKTAPDGTETVTDKQNVTWTKPPTAQIWTGSTGGTVPVTSPAATKLDAIAKTSPPAETPGFLQSKIKQGGYKQGSNTQDEIKAGLAKGYARGGYYESVDLAEILWRKMKSKE